VHEGIHLERGLVTALLAKDTFNTETRLHNPYIFVTNKRLTSHQDVAGILDQIHALGGSLLLVADAIEGDALSVLIRNHLSEIMAIAAIHAPEYGDQRLETLHDLAALTGGLVFQQELGGAIPIEYFGRADEVVATKKSTLILRPHRNSGQSTLRLGEAQQQMNDDRLSQYDQERRQKRVGNLRGKTAIINVGAATDVETGELLEKTERLLHAVRAGLQHGVVPGAGAALIAAAAEAAALLKVDGDQQLGAAIVFGALAEPARQLLRNAQIDDVLAKQIIDRYGIIGNNMIYDIERQQWANPYQTGVADSFQAMQSAIQTASSAASVFLNASVVVINEYPT
jgi:chaperonin GroEL